MQIENTELEISRVEKITKTYDKQGHIIAEQWEFYYPKEKSNSIGFEQQNLCKLKKNIQKKTSKNSLAHSRKNQKQTKKKTQ